MLSFLNGDICSGRDRIGTDEFCVLFVRIDDDLRVQLAPVLFHDQLSLSRLFIDFALGRNPFNEVFVLDVAWTLANDRNVVLLPMGDLLFSS